MIEGNFLKLSQTSHSHCHWRRKDDIATVGVGTARWRILDMDIEIGDFYLWEKCQLPVSDPDQTSWAKNARGQRFGHKKNDIVEVTVPSGKIKFKILKIS